VTPLDPDEQRSTSRDMWEEAASGWSKRADRVRDWGMPVSAAMMDALALQPGQRVLELAAGPGDTGFMAAELVKPGGTLISSDGAEAMVEVARARGADAGLQNVEYRQLELEWIDLEAASVDAVICRWGIMLIVDPDAAAQEARRVLRPGGRASFAVWDGPERNPWATVPSRALIGLGHSAPPDPDAPGMFRLAADGRLQEVLEGAGFIEVSVQPVRVQRHYETLDQYIEETVDMSPMFSGTFHELSGADRAAVLEQISAGAQQFTAEDGSVLLPGTSLVAVASA